MTTYPAPKDLHTVEYDENLKTLLPHLRNYPEMLPHIGSKYNEADKRILLIGESHYIARNEIESDCFDDWYNGNSAMLQGYHYMIHTRNVVQLADYRYHFEKGLTIFYNIKAAILSCWPFVEDKLVYRYLSFYNFFQRPAYIQGNSIDNNEQDNNIAYDTFKVMLNILQPQLVVFTSRKAFNTFNWLMHARKELELFNGFKIENVPHPATSWWYRKSKHYTINGVPAKGREKFIHLISH